MSLAASLSFIAFLAAAPGKGDRLEDYGGKHRCNDEAVKAQVVQAMTSKSSISSGGIKAGPSQVVLDGKAVEVALVGPTAIVSKPGASGSPSSLRLGRTAPGGAVDVLMCRFRRAPDKPWSKVSTADLKVDGGLAKRLPASVKGLGRAFALTEDPAMSDDSVVIAVASPVGGSMTKVKVSAVTKGLQRRKKAGPVKAGRNAGKRILAEASDPSWQQYEYGQRVVFPEAAGEVTGYEDKAFDCSYYVWLVYKRVGIDYDFASTKQLADLNGGQFVEVKEPRPGDLVVWRPELGSGNIQHVGIVAEDVHFFWDNSGSESVALSDDRWGTYDVPRKYIRRKGL